MYTYEILQFAVICLLQLLTHLWEGDVVLGATLWTADRSAAVPLLLFIQPALQTRLVDPFGAALASAWTHPLGAVVVPLGGETHPAVSVEETKRVPSLRPSSTLWL